MKMKKESKKQEKYDMHALKYYLWKKALYNAHTTGENDLHEFWGNHGRYYLFSKWVNWCQLRGWLFERGHTNGHHFNSQGWHSGLVAPISSIIGLLILYIVMIWLERAESLITS